MDQTISGGISVRAGRYVQGREVRPFLIATSDKAVDWAALDQDAVPKSLRTLVRAALQSGADSDFCAALPYIEDYIASDASVVRSAPSVPVDGPLAPPVRPRNFICIGLNYVDHAHESKMELPAHPLLFAKTANAIAGHNHPICVPRGSERMDYEAELVVVIGRPCRRVRAASALEYVAGYTCGNDVSARDFQFDDGQWFRGKSCDGFGPLGPWLVTKSEIPDLRALRIQCRVNGQSMQDSSTAHLIFGVSELIEYVSTFIALEPGDVISTGTPPGVGFARKPPVVLRPGDVVEVDIEKIGVLSNPICQEAGCQGSESHPT
jgi:2-keto-4-pentenoate hydratase/2-oxohepta-3-ene-1,7-dioic acid hydratase in catechol pathway